MTFQLDHEGARKLAKALSVRAGREVKLKDIYEDIGSIFGMRGDAMMHALKTGGGTAPRGHAPAEEKETLGLQTLGRFVSQMDIAVRHREFWNVVVAVTFLGSLAGVRSSAGEIAAGEHLERFAALLRPNPECEFHDAFHAYLGDGYFVSGWPRLDPSIDYEERVAAELRGMRRDLDPVLGDPAAAHAVRHEFAAGAWVTDNREYDRRDIKAMIDRCRTTAFNQVAARRELAAFPLVRFV